MYSHDSQVTKYREVDCPNRTIKIMQFDIMGLYGDNIDKIKQDELTRIRYIIPGSIEDIVCKKYNEEHPTPKLIEKEQLKPLNVKQKVVPKRQFLELLLILFPPCSKDFIKLDSLERF